MVRTIIAAALMSSLALAGFAQNRSAKRGIGWDEKNVSMNAAHIDLMKTGVSWAYNWGPAPKNADLFAEASMHFAPMCWNSSYDESRIRSFVKAHPETKYLLGFNEPNFSQQSNMTPAAAAAQWPKVEKLASELGLVLVAPALNFSGELVGGRIWSPYEWLDEFVRIYPGARMDCLALHCYMNWYSSTIWFATEYFYKDLYDPKKKDVYGKYPNLVKWLDAHKEACGSFPRMMLTEFCSWENDGTITGVDFQIDQMTQKLQLLEQSEIVEGYAWFMANGTENSYPYFSMFERNSATSGLSVLGEVYVNLSSFDRERLYMAGEKIQAKDYVDATKDSQQIKVRPTTDTDSEAPLQIEMPSSGWTEYQIDVPADGEYVVAIRVNSSSDNKLVLYVDGKKHVTETVKSTDGSWTEREFSSNLTAGHHSVMFYNSSSSPLLLDEWRFSSSSGVTDMEDGNTESVEKHIYDLAGCAVEGTPAPGIYIVCEGSKVSKVRF